MTFNQATITLSASRSYASLARAVHTINDNLYKDELFAEDRIVLKDFYAKDGSLTHFEITASPLDFFMIGARYGSIEERKRPRLAYRELADMVESVANDVPKEVSNRPSLDHLPIPSWSRKLRESLQEKAYKSRS